MRRKTKRLREQLELYDIPPFIATAPCVPALREIVKSWREGGYKGATDTTRELLNHWFLTDHLTPNGRRFCYYDAQREAVETLIYVYEIAKVRARLELIQRFATATKDLRLPPYDDFARYCIKMATGSGKTKVMSLAVVWHYFNAVREDDGDYAKTFLVIAPNVIVFERLRKDFAGGHIFRADPLFPKHFELFWDFDCYMRDEGERAHSEGALFLTNIQQFYERPGRTAEDEPDEITAVMGAKPQTQKLELTDFDERIARRGGPLLVLNDEAHHTHDEDSEWNKVIRKLGVKNPIASQLDFSATPRYQKGGLFAWTLYDYPLKQAILDGVVKRPVKGVADIQEAKSDIASVRYEGFLTAGVERWKEYRQQLAPLGKKPILFVMLNSTAEADEVGDYLRVKYPNELGGDKTLVIHTDTKGEVSKKDLDTARQLAREVDEPDCPVNAIVSVLMLREGWDVQNVTVVVGLRPYTSKANILPEQTIGRGLRLMFRHLHSPPSTGQGGDYTERVDVIGNKAFIAFVEDLEKLEGLTLDTFDVGKDKLRILTIMPMPEKMAYDIGVPTLSPLLVRKKSLAEDIANLDVMALNCPVLPRKKGDAVEKTFQYEGYDIITLEKIIERDYTIPEPQTAQEVIGYYARRIASDVKLPSQFSALAPKVREFFERKAFGAVVNLDDKALIKAMSSNVAGYVVVKTFGNALREKIIEPTEPQLTAPERMLSSTPPFPHSRPTFEAAKCVFNYVPCDNEFERDFAKFLQSAGDVEAFSKLPEPFGFAIEYTDTVANLRYYYPDFVVRLTNGENWIVETKGQETIEVERKATAAQIWCENATILTGTAWRYLKVPQKDFEQLQPSLFSDVVIL